VDLGLAGKRALVTGSSKGIGKAIAAALAGEGARVTICARHTDALDAAAGDIRSRGGEVLAVAADLATDEGVERVWRAQCDSYGGADVLVNNVTGGPSPRDVLAATDADWLASYTMNVVVHVRFIRRALPAMLEGGWGRIVNISSTSGRQPDDHVPTYGPAKAALINLSKQLANLYSRQGVLTNCVCPGITRTEAAMAAAVRRTGRREDDPGRVFDDYFGPRRPLPAGRFGEPEDTAFLVALLCSERAAWITGTCIDVDGGWIKSIM
jgi:NAD(P)-dependent dehydrogenase (short-subunit alcohol dehydrogenase family)